MLKVFDVLYLDGEQVIDRPFSERRALLESGRCFAPLAHYLELSEVRVRVRVRVRLRLRLRLRVRVRVSSP